jgi:DNA-binding XRE family transcriptional regulator
MQITDRDFFLGCAVLMAISKPGEPITHAAIAAACGCTRATVYQIEKKALSKLAEKRVIADLYEAQFNTRPKRTESYWSRQMRLRRVLQDRKAKKWK